MIQMVICINTYIYKTTFLLIKKIFFVVSGFLKIRELRRNSKNKSLI